MDRRALHRPIATTPSSPIAVGVGLDMGRGTTAFSELARYEIGDAAFNSASLGLRVHW